MVDTRAFSEVFKMFGDFKMPQMDLNDMFASQRRNLEAFSSASQAVTEGVQAISRRQAEVARANVEQYLKASREMLSAGSPETNAAKQADYARAMFESSINNLREVSEMVSKTMFEAADVINQRMTESFEEASSAASNATGRKRKTAAA